MKLPIIITPGDPEGIGPEITWKFIKKNYKNLKTPILCIGAHEPFEKLRAKIIFADDNSLKKGTPKSNQPYIWLLPAPSPKNLKTFLPGFQAGWSVAKAIDLIQKQKASALVTGPIHKERLQKGGYPYAGHTELLADLTHTKNVTMMLANPLLKVSLVTTHLALKDVPKRLTRQKIRTTFLNTLNGLKRHWKIKKPKIAILALNPHAGESGLLGREEISIITPEVNFLKKKYRHSAEVSGPYPADTFFTKIHKQHFDAVICMYHDQGLIPAKLLDFGRTINITLGLPLIRTSVDHGVAFDIAGKNKADASSLQAAFMWAQSMSSRKKGN
jgi:4-hydroxythreonine-4-phosphate dehydrogenase